MADDYLKNIVRYEDKCMHHQYILDFNRIYHSKIIKFIWSEDKDSHKEHVTAVYRDELPKGWRNWKSYDW